MSVHNLLGCCGRCARGDSRHWLDAPTTPGRRVYTAVDAMPRVANGLGITIVSTPKGVMADHAAREANVGGEVLCKVF